MDKPPYRINRQDKTPQYESNAISLGVDILVYTKLLILLSSLAKIRISNEYPNWYSLPQA